MFRGVGRVAHAELAPAQIDEHVGNQLTGTVIGHLTTTVTVDDGYPARIQKVLGPASLAQGEHARVLEQPQLIVTPMVAQIGEVAHFLQSFDIVA